MPRFLLQRENTCALNLIRSAHVSHTQEEKWLYVCVCTGTKELLSPLGTTGEWHHPFHCGTAESWDLDMCLCVCCCFECLCVICYHFSHEKKADLHQLPPQLISSFVGTILSIELKLKEWAPSQTSQTQHQTSCMLQQEVGFHTVVVAPNTEAQFLTKNTKHYVHIQYL